MRDYLPDNRVRELVGETLLEARKPRAKKPDVPFSDKQIEVHYDDLYIGYLKKLSEIERRLKDAERRSANSTYSEFRSLKKEAAFTLNAVRLHELYFAGMGKTKRSEFVEQAINRSFGRASAWEDDFIACGLSARGWVVLGYDQVDKKLVNMISDAHDGGVWQVFPIIVLDCYEHARYIDFGSNMGKYIEFFMAHINWDKVASRLSEVGAGDDTV